MLPDFTKEQYLQTTEPYEALYKYIDDKFMMTQLREQMKARAAELGIKSFVSLWNAFLEMKNNKGDIKLDNATDFSSQPLELMSGEYICNDAGVATYDRYGYESMICKHPIMPIQRLVNIDTQEERLKLAYKKGGRWRELIVEKSVIATNKILDLSAFGILVNTENSKQLSTYLLELEQINYNNIPEQMSVGRLGWIGDYGFSPYVEGITFDGDFSFQHIFKAIKQDGSFDEWTQAMRELRQGTLPGRLCLAASFASVLVEPLGLLPFFVHLWGGTEAGKTVALMIAASVWGSPKVGDYVTTFNSTAVAQELQAGFLNSLPMCLDELQIQASQGIKDFDKMIYQLSEGVGKSRGAKTGGLQRNQTWRNCILTNGESPISTAQSGGGAVNRVLEYECEEKVAEDLPGLVDKIVKNYGHAGRKFVEYLQTEDGMARAKKLQKKYYNELLKSDSTDKQAASASALLTADHLATEIIFKDNKPLTITNIKKIMATKAQVDVHTRALEFVYELIAKNQNKFNLNNFGEYQGEMWGHNDSDGKIYFIKSVFDMEMSKAGYNSQAFLSWAKRKHIISAEVGKNTKKKRFKNMDRSLNCVCFDPELEQKMMKIAPDSGDLPF